MSVKNFFFFVKKKTRDCFLSFCVPLCVRPAQMVYIYIHKYRMTCFPSRSSSFLQSRPVLDVSFLDFSHFCLKKKRKSAKKRRKVNKKVLQIPWLRWTIRDLGQTSTSRAYFFRHSSATERWVYRRRWRWASSWPSRKYSRPMKVC